MKRVVLICFVPPPPPPCFVCTFRGTNCRSAATALPLRRRKNCKGEHATVRARWGRKKRTQHGRRHVSRTAAFIAQQSSPRVTCSHTPGQLPAERLLPDCPLCGCQACPTVEAGSKHDSSATIIIPFYSRKEVHAQYVADFMRFSTCTTLSRPLSRERFCHEWRKKLPHIRVSRLKSAWARCDECTDFRTLIKSAKRKEERQRLKLCYEAHLDHQRRQRARYYKHRNKALQYALLYLSIIMDDGSKKI